LFQWGCARQTAERPTTALRGLWLAADKIESRVYDTAQGDVILGTLSCFDQLSNEI